MRLPTTLLLLSVLIPFVNSPVVHAQSGASQILEKARAQAREVGELRAALNDPDQNVRLAVFDAMLKGENETLRMMAIETGLTGADSVMRLMAFKTLMMNLDQLHVAFKVDPEAPKALQDTAGKIIADWGTSMTVGMKAKKPEEGAFSEGNWRGQVSGLEVIFTGISVQGSLRLQDDNTLKGVVQIKERPFLASARVL